MSSAITGKRSIARTPGRPIASPIVYRLQRWTI
jgi:hypothetical protein